MANKNTEYELLVAEIYQGMLAYDGYENLRVEHDVTITGKSGATHQIDVFWEFKLAGTTYRTCVECRNYTSPIKKSQVAAFAATLQDIGNANGIIATTASFQKGALLFAKQHDIRLVLVNHLLKSIHLHMSVQSNQFENVEFKFDQTSVRKALTANDLKSFNLQDVILGDDPLLNAQGEPDVTLNDLIRSHRLEEGHNVIPATGLFYAVQGLGLVELESIDFDLYYLNHIHESLIELPTTAKAAIEDILDNNVHYLHEDGSVNDNVQ